VEKSLHDNDQHIVGEFIECSPAAEKQWQNAEASGESTTQD
jgi:hypothetical protein